MMKKLVCLLLVIVSAICMCTACTDTPDDSSSGEPVVYTITFSQEGQEDVVKQVEEGKSLADVPVPAEKSGYTVVWNVTDFSNIQENIQVMAVATPNEYTITYTYNPLLDNSYTVNLEKETQKVTYNTEYTLASASAYNSDRTLVFVGWVDATTGEPVENGVYTTAGNITLVAKFDAPTSEWS